jgi:hypothetical protein
MAELFPGILLDVVDDEWLVDKLPHDETPFPPGVAPPADEIDESSTEFKPSLWQTNTLCMYLSVPLVSSIHVFRSLTVTHLIGFLCGRSRATSCKSGQVDRTRIAHHPVDPLLQSQLHCIGELKHFAITMFVEDGKSAFKLRQGNAHFP